jgi:tripartite-type tricarboxylate transporter receptor subunit TctC
MLVSRRSLMFLTCASLVAAPLTAPAAVTKSFFQGKTITLIVGYPPAGAPDTFIRLASRYLASHIPGNPSIIVENMPGAGSLRAANYLYNEAPRDGTVLGLLAPTLPLEERLGEPGVEFKSAKYSWIGRMTTALNITFVMNTSSVKAIGDAFNHVAVLGATGKASTNFIYPNVMNNVLGTRFKIVAGYDGTADVMLAMDRGEVDGNSATYDGLVDLHENWVKTKRVNIIVQYALKRDPLLPDVPTMVELARTKEQSQIFRAVSSASDIGKFLVTTPGVPSDRVATLRRAFDAMVKDPEYIADAEKLRIGLNPLRGEELQNIVADVESLPPDVAKKVKVIYPAF